MCRKTNLMNLKSPGPFDNAHTDFLLEYEIIITTPAREKSMCLFFLQNVSSRRPPNAGGTNYIRNKTNKFAKVSIQSLCDENFETFPTVCSALEASNLRN